MVAFIGLEGGGGGVLLLEAALVVGGGGGGGTLATVVGGGGGGGAVLLLLVFRSQEPAAGAFSFANSSKKRIYIASCIPASASIFCRIAIFRNMQGIHSHTFQDLP